MIKISQVTKFVDPDTMEPMVGINMCISLDRLMSHDKESLYATIGHRVTKLLEDEMAKLL